MDPMGLRVTQNVYFVLLPHTKKLLLLTYCNMTAKTGVSFSFQTHIGGNTHTDGWTDRHDSRNSDVQSPNLNMVRLDEGFHLLSILTIFQKKKCNK